MTLATNLIDKGKVEGKVEGKIEGLLKAIEMGLNFKFGTAGLNLFERIKSIKSLEKIQLITDAVEKAKNLNDVSRLI